ncbi:hypothetical protein D3C83_295020 [compost metagenome]
MAVADLKEGESVCRRRYRFIDNAERSGHAARYCPEHAGACPCHAFENLAAVHAVIVLSHFAPP